MAKRTTRQKIVYHANKIPEHVDRIMADLMAIDELAGGRSDPIKEMLPPLMVLTDEYQQTIEHFIRQL